MKTKQATKATPEGVRLHIVRQRFLGERMVGERKYSRIPETLAATAGLLAMLFYSVYRGWIWL